VIHFTTRFRLRSGELRRTSRRDKSPRQAGAARIRSGNTVNRFAIKKYLGSFKYLINPKTIIGNLLIE
jgi:hypothetical protein